MDSAFLNLVRGNRLATYMGLTMDGEIAYRFSQDYTYVEVPVGEILDLSTEKPLRKNAKIVAGTVLRMVPAGKIDNRTYKCMASFNPDIQKLCPGSPSLLLIEPGERQQPSITVTAASDCTAADLTGSWFVRLYLMA